MVKNCDLGLENAPSRQITYIYLLCLRRRSSPVNYFQECECERRINNSTIRWVSCFFSSNIFGINVWLGHLPLFLVSREFVFSVLRGWNLLKDQLTHKTHFELSATGSMLWKYRSLVRFLIFFQHQICQPAFLLHEHKINSLFIFYLYSKDDNHLAGLRQQVLQC